MKISGLQDAHHYRALLFGQINNPITDFINLFNLRNCSQSTLIEGPFTTPQREAWHKCKSLSWGDLGASLELLNLKKIRHAGNPISEELNLKKKCIGEDARGPPYRGAFGSSYLESPSLKSCICPRPDSADDLR